jgi:hypothetical protein
MSSHAKALPTTPNLGASSPDEPRSAEGWLSGAVMAL